MNTYRPPILRSKKYDHASLFDPESLLREARRQKNIPKELIPSICILDPDGDIVRNLVAAGRAKVNSHWACYHTTLYNFEYKGIEFGIVGCAVGASFAVLIAEELFVSGCQLLISVTSSGLILSNQKPPFFVLIERALRDEGTSYHYLQPSDFSNINKELLAMLKDAFSKLTIPVNKGATWTTDAPFRETGVAIKQAQSLGLLAVEMEASALYAFAQVCQRSVICFAHVTNQMGNIEGDFEKGEADGSKDALELIAATAKTWLSRMENQNMKNLMKPENKAEANVIKSVLEKHGIYAEIRSIHDTAYDGLFQSQYGWGVIRVSETDFPKAQRIIEEWENASPGELPWKNKLNNA